MAPYHLAKVILMAGGIRSRKRIQKTLHLLQAAGCNLGLDYRMHYYGPYCAELAESLDRMARDRLLIEAMRSTDKGIQYDYQFNEAVRPGFDRYEATPEGHAAKLALERYHSLVANLCSTPARVLELASTAVEFMQSDGDWDAALKKTADFKGEVVGSPNMREALQLAQSVLDGGNG